MLRIRGRPIDTPYARPEVGQGIDFKFDYLMVGKGFRPEVLGGFYVLAHSLVRFRLPGGESVHTINPRSSLNIIMKLSFLLCASVLISVSGIAEEEIWYNADGEAIKTVQQTPVEAGERKIQARAWKPAWVIRERERRGKSNHAFSPDPSWLGHRYNRVRLYPWSPRFYLTNYPCGLGSPPRHARAVRFFRYPGFSGILIR
jgi:hypothetical protein